MQTPSSPESTLRWDDVRVLLALYRRGSLKRGAEALGVNISTASRRLDALEASLGVRLFDRTPDGTHATDATEQLIPFAEGMEHAAVRMASTLEQLEVEPEGEVRIAAPPGVVDHFLAPNLVELCTRYPRLRVVILSSIGYADLSRREADLALRLKRPDAGDFVSTRVSHHGWALAASPTMARELGKLRDPNAARWITWGEDLAHSPDSLWIDEHVDPERVVLRTSSMTAQIEAVRTGLGVVLMPAPWTNLPGLTAVPCTPRVKRTVDALPAAPLWLVGHRALRDVPRFAVVWEWLKERLLAHERVKRPRRP